LLSYQSLAHLVPPDWQLDPKGKFYSDSSVSR
jgi:hypothetical protein